MYVVCKSVVMEAKSYAMCSRYTSLLIEASCVFKIFSLLSNIATWNSYALKKVSFAFNQVLNVLLCIQTCFVKKKIPKGDISKTLRRIVMGMLRKRFCTFLYNYTALSFSVYLTLCYLLYFDSLTHFHIESRGNAWLVVTLLLIFSYT